MRNVLVATSLIVLVPSASAAGEVFGTITPAEGETEVRVRCEKRTQNTFTDSRGAYRLYVSHRGDCRLSVRPRDKDWTDELRVFSSDRPARYDLRIRQQEGGLRLERQ